MKKAKIKNKPRLSGWITGICIFLAVTLSIGFLSQLSPDKAKDNNEKLPGIEELIPQKPAAHGGVLLNRVDFEDVDAEAYYFTNKYDYTAVPGICFKDLAYGNPDIISEGDNKYYDFKFNEALTTTESAYITVLPNGGNEIDANFDLTKYSYLTVDFDFKGGDPVLQMVLLTRDSARSIVSKPTSVYTGQDQYGYEDFLWSWEEYKTVSNELLTVPYDYDAWVHVTYAYYIDHADYTKSKMHVYLNGEFAYSLDNVLIAAPTMVEGLRFNVMDCSTWNIDNHYSLDNIEFYGFEAGYNGAISELFRDTTVNLEDCSDSNYGK